MYGESSLKNIFGYTQYVPMYSPFGGNASSLYYWLKSKFRIMEIKRSSGFRRIFKVAFHLFLALPARGSNPAGKSPNLT